MRRTKLHVNRIGYRQLAVDLFLLDQLLYSINMPCLELRHLGGCIDSILCC